MSRLFIHLPNEEGTGYYRAKLPVQQCYSQMSSEGIELILNAKLDGSETSYDGYLCHCLPVDAFTQFLRHVKRLGKKVVWSIDDDLWRYPPWQPNAEIFRDK